MPSSSTANCSSGVLSRDVKPAAWSNRQKSLRGFAKCAPAAAETQPGWIPQKTTRRPGARTSGTALALGGFFGDGVRVTGVQRFLERTPERLAFEQHPMPRAAWYKPHDPHRRVPTAVAPGVALRLAQRPKPSHSRTLGATPDGRVKPVRAEP